MSIGVPRRQQRTPQWAAGLVVGAPTLHTPGSGELVARAGERLPRAAQPDASRRDNVVDVHGLFFGGRSIGTLLLACSLLAASVLWRRQPGIALGLVWVCGFLALLGGFPPPLAGALVCALVSFGCARYGSTAVLWSSAVSIAASMLFVVAAAVLGADAYGSVTSMVVDSAGTAMGVVTEESNGVGNPFGWARYAVGTGIHRSRRFCSR